MRELKVGTLYKVTNPCSFCIGLSMDGACGAHVVTLQPDSLILLTKMEYVANADYPWKYWFLFEEQEIWNGFQFEDSMIKHYHSSFEEVT